MSQRAPSTTSPTTPVQPIESLLRLLTSTAELAGQMLGHDSRPAPRVAVPPVPVSPASGLTMPALAIEGRLRLALSTTEVAGLLFGRDDQAARQVVLRLIAAGQLTAQCTGRAYLISTASLLAYLSITPTSSSSSGPS